LKCDQDDGITANPGNKNGIALLFPEKDGITGHRTSHGISDMPKSSILQE
jgi:hypothetical protein